MGKLSNLKRIWFKICKIVTLQVHVHNIYRKKSQAGVCLAMSLIFWEFELEFTGILSACRKKMCMSMTKSHFLSMIRYGMILTAKLQRYCVIACHYSQVNMPVVDMWRPDVVLLNTAGQMLNFQQKVSRKYIMHVNEWISEWMKYWMDDWTNTWTYEQRNE